MAHSKPERLNNRGDARRATIVAGYFVTELMGDARVNALYVQWRDARETGRRALDLALSRPYQNPDAAAERLMGIAQQYDACELGSTHSFVREALGLPYSWIAPALLQCFRIRVHNERANDRHDLGIPVYVLPEHSKGRAPRDAGADLQRDVQWFYRCIVRKQAGDNIQALADEHAANARRTNECHSVVQNGLNRVRAFLELIERRHIVTKPGFVITKDTGACNLR